MDTTTFLNTSDFVANSFVSSKSGLLRSNKFMIQIIAPPAIEKIAASIGGDFNLDSLVWNCVGATVTDFNCDMGQNQINGVPRNYYKNRQDSDLGLTFLDDNELRIRRFFAAWMAMGFDLANQSRGYYDDVAAKTIKVFPVTPTGEKIAADVYVSALPYQISNIDYNAHNEDVLIRTDVKFKYTFHEIEYANAFRTELKPS